MRILILPLIFMLTGCLTKPKYTPAFANFEVTYISSIIGLTLAYWVCNIVKLRKCLELRGL